MYKTVKLIFLFGAVSSLFACTTIESPKEKRERAVCGVFLHNAQESWNKGNLSDIYKSYPKMGKTQKEGLRNLSDGIAYCQQQIFVGRDYTQARLELEKVRERINSHYTKQEEKIFHDRTGGKKLCKDNQLTDIVVFNGTPYRECAYFHASPSIYVSQVTPSGLLISGYGVNRMYFVFKGAEIDKSLVDNDKLPGGFFQYTGPYSYNSLLGPRTVHSFKRINGKPMSGFLFYGGRAPKG